MPFDLVASDSKGGAGGTCVLRGCVPKKLMVYGGEFAQAFKDSKGFGSVAHPLQPSCCLSCDCQEAQCFLASANFGYSWAHPL